MTDREEDDEEELFSRGEVGEGEGEGCSRGDLTDRLLSLDFSRGERGCEEDIEDCRGDVGVDDKGVLWLRAGLKSKGGD